MKIQKASQWFTLFFFAAMIAACVLLTESRATPSTVASVSPASAISITEESANSVPIGTPFPSSTLTAVPTLSVDNARKKFLELLAANGNCRLPCLWGITPGQSNYQEARAILSPLNSMAETFFEPSTVNDISMGSVSPLYVETDLRINTRVAYWYDHNNTVDHIAFRVLEERVTKDSSGNWTGTRPVFDSEIFAERVQYYSLSHMLSEQGIPAAVLVHASALSDPVVAGGIDISLLYPEQGIAVNYMMQMYNEGSVKKGCPAIAHIDMELYPPGNPASFFSELEETNWGRAHLDVYSLEEATEISVEEFYQTFHNPTDKCIKTPANLWSLPR